MHRSVEIYTTADCLYDCLDVLSVLSLFRDGRDRDCFLVMRQGAL